MYNLFLLAINEAREISSIPVDETVNVFKFINASLWDGTDNGLGQLKQFGDIVTLGVDENITTCKTDNVITLCNYILPML